MNKMCIFFLSMFFLIGKGHALIPIEGIIYGEVRDIKQYDPFVGMLTSNYLLTDKNSSEENKLTYYTALYKQGYNLQNSCDQVDRIKYSNFWKEDTAKRSFAATLQYLGLDISVRSIANYAKKLGVTKEKYDLLYTNLVQNTCSQNLTVYSHQMLKSNFKYYWSNDTKLALPSIADNPYFGDYIKKQHNTKSVLEREFHYTVLNFRSLCSWDLDTHNFGMMKPYLKNPFLISYVMNNLVKKKLNLDVKTEELFLTKTKEGVQVACENLICRKRSPNEFEKLFPRMNGSDQLRDDLNQLYCNNFSNIRTIKSLLAPQQKEWLKGTNRNKQKIEAMNLVSLITGVPELLITAKVYPDIAKFLKMNIKNRWDLWAKKKSNQFNMEQMYEESLDVSLISQQSTNAVELGNYNVKFNVELGEIDKVLNGYDKIDSTFYLKFPISQIESLKEKIPFYYNSNRFKKLQNLENVFVKNIAVQLEKKKKYFKVPLWNNRMATLLAKELMGQFLKNNRKFSHNLSKKVVKIPVTFSFGVFALQYIREKFIFRYKNPDLLTAKK